MAIDTAPNELGRRRMAESAAGTRQIRLAKPEEGESRGEVFHLIRAFLLVIAGTALIGWLVS